jgi:hypothetical protein
MFPVTLAGYSFEDSMLTFNLATGITAAHVGRAVSVDTSVANTVKLAADGDEIIGRLETVELRTQEGSSVGAVALRFCQLLPIKTGETIVVGDVIEGAGDGEVKAKAIAGTAYRDRCRAWAIVGTYVSAILI